MVQEGHQEVVKPDKLEVFPVEHPVLECVDLASHLLQLLLAAHLLVSQLVQHCYMIELELNNNFLLLQAILEPVIEVGEGGRLIEVFHL